MSILTHRASLTLITAATEAAGGKLPKPAQQAITTAQRVQSFGLALPRTSDLIDATLDAIAAERTPAEDDTVIRIAAARLLATQVSSQALEERSWARAIELCVESAEPIIKAWRPGFDKAAATMTAAAEVVGNEALADHEAILKRGGHVAESYLRAVDAEKVVTKVAQGWTALAQAARLTINPQMAIKIADLSHAQLVHHELEGKPSPWEIVRAGVTLSLPSLEEYRRRSLAAVAPPMQTAQESFQETRRRESRTMREAQAADLAARKAVSA